MILGGSVYQSKESKTEKFSSQHWEPVAEANLIMADKEACGFLLNGHSFIYLVFWYFSML